MQQIRVSGRRRSVVVGVVILGFVAGCSSERAQPVPSPSAPPSTVPTSTLPTPTPSVSPAFGGGVAGVRGTPPPRSRVRESEGALVATRLAADPGCDGADAFMTLTWRPATQRGAEQRVAVSVREDGFETGEYRVSEALSPSATRYRLSEVHAGGIYYWRVLTRHGDRYDASDVETFMGPTCTADRPDY